MPKPQKTLKITKSQQAAAAGNETDMTWDYRVVRRIIDGAETLAIHQAFYARPGDDIPRGLSDEPAQVTGNDPAQILSRMSEALNKPVVEFDRVVGQSDLEAFLAAEDRRLYFGLKRKADGMDVFLARMKSTCPSAPQDWPCDEVPALPPGGYIAYLRKLPHRDFLVEFPDIPGCTAHGHSLENATSMAQQALHAHLQTLRRTGGHPVAATPWADLAEDPRRKGAVMAVVEPCQTTAAQEDKK